MHNRRGNAPRQGEVKVEEEEGTSLLESFVKRIRPFFAPGGHTILMRIAILSIICIIAFAIRLFAVLRYESVIHEFDPYFNFRSTKILVEKGFHEFYNWFDDFSWYPLGRVIGGTVYPGLMATSAFVFWLLESLHIYIDIRNVCVLLAPLFASFTCIAMYFLTKEVHNKRAGLVAAALVAVIPGYISRSVAGSYDNECVAIFALVFTFYLFVKSVNTGSLFYSSLCALSYFYMVNAWGGYIFICNIIPLYVLVMIACDRFSRRLYVAYTTFFVLGTLLSMQVRFVGFLAVQSSEHMASHGVFGIMQLYALIVWLRSRLTKSEFYKLVRMIFVVLGALVAIALLCAFATGYIAPWTGRFYSLLDPTYAKDHIPIIASVSEHQPTTWSSFFFDLYIITYFIPVGLYFCFQDLNDGKIFIILYCVTSVYFSGVMVRLMLVLAPVGCVLSGIGISSVMSTYMSVLKETVFGSNTSDKLVKSKKVKRKGLRSELALVIVLALTFLLITYTFHCTWVTSEAYSSPSIVLAARHGDSRIIFDDFREAYYWLSKNTPVDAKIMSWWDYGYQITGMANRTVIVDNNTWNNSHIATVGRAMSSSEDKAFEIVKMLDVDYVLVIFGGLTGYQSDDINKFLWMVRIGGNVFPEIIERDYYSERGMYTINNEASPTMLNSLMYRLSYYRFGEIMTDYNQPSGFDRARNVEIGLKDFKLKHFEEAFTSEHWMVRLYRVKHDHMNRV